MNQFVGTYVSTVSRWSETVSAHVHQEMAAIDQTRAQVETLQITSLYVS